MRILKLKIQGYRSLKDVVWHPGSLNVLIGPNGVGKSNLLRVLELLAMSAQGRLGRYIQRAGGMEPLLWDGKTDQLRFDLETSPVLDKDRTDRDGGRKNLTYQLALARIGRGSSYRIEHELLGSFFRVETGQGREPLKMLERQSSRAVVFDEAQHSLVAPEETVLEDESLLSMASGPFTQNRLIPPFQKFVAQWSVYHDVQVHVEAPIRQPTVARHETRVDFDGQNLINVLHTLYTTDRSFRSDIDKAMRAAFGDDFEELVFPPAADQRIQLMVRWKSLSRAQSAADLSDGTLRFLFLLTVLGSPDPAPLVAVDEPENGLHPAMLPIVAEFAVEASRRAQVILTTHSPEFLDAFYDADLTTTVVKWAAGRTSLHNVTGRALDAWLKEYTLGALFRSGELEGLLVDDVPSEPEGSGEAEE